MVRCISMFIYILFVQAQYLYCSLVILTARDGRVSKLEQVYLRGGQVKFIVLPESLKSSTIFKKVQQLSRAKKDVEVTAGRGGAGRGGAGRGTKRQKVA